MTSKLDGCCLFSVLLQEPTTGSEQCLQNTHQSMMGHDRNVLQCLSSIVQVEELPSHSHEVASLLLTLGGLGVGGSRRSGTLLIGAVGQTVWR